MKVIFESLINGKTLEIVKLNHAPRKGECVSLFATGEKIDYTVRLVWWSTHPEYRNTAWVFLKEIIKKEKQNEKRN